LLQPSVASAQSDEAAAAEALFKQARDLFDAGKIGAACEKFAESERLDSSAGTLLNLARCREEEGRTASAWSAYLAAKRAAKTDGRDAMANEATRRAAELEAKLSYLTVVVRTPVDGLAVARGGEPITAATFGAKLPIDPGEHVFVARAPGYEEWTGQVTVRHGESETITIPALVALPEQAKEPRKLTATTDDPARSVPAPVESGIPTTTYLVGGLGLAVTGAGLAFGVMANSSYNEASRLCPSTVGCSADAMNERSQAGTFATVATIAVPVGVAGLATGVVLWAMDDEGAAPSDAMSAQVAWLPGGGFAQVGGSF
jgi:hypothetical protein